MEMPSLLGRRLMRSRDLGHCLIRKVGGFSGGQNVMVHPAKTQGIQRCRSLAM
jgi:hypothetical protein